ncbi:MAG: serine/threonine-protein phosphatase [Anaerolineales bacterium]|nr:serine/threonine-protein phosphatase [Anaerolineales bacterium]
MDEELVQAARTKERKPYQLNVGHGQSVGIQRDHNEDAFFTLTTMLAYNETELPIGFYIVADGMGGHQNGEIASELAIRSIVEHVFHEILTPLLSLNPQPQNSSFQEVFHTGIEQANTEIVRNSYGGGTTVTSVLIIGEQMTIAHVGDSRVYAVDPTGVLEALTRDHSLVKRLQELGQISSEEAAIHPQRNVLYRALGQGEPFEPEIISMKRPDEGYLLICSDGLWNIVQEQKISDIILNSPSPQEAVSLLIEAANQAGGPDNISVILVDLPDLKT